MTKKDFFTVLIKIFGLYFFVSVLLSIMPQSAAYLFMGSDLKGVLWLATIIIGNLALLYVFLLKADTLTRLLKLNQGFDDDRIDFSKLKSLDLIKISVLLIGGVLLIDNFPPFFQFTLHAFQTAISANEPTGLAALDLKYGQAINTSLWVNSGIGLIIGYLLISNFKKWSVFLDNKVND